MRKYVRHKIYLRCVVKPNVENNVIIQRFFERIFFELANTNLQDTD